jgi:hypothetical protein
MRLPDQRSEAPQSFQLRNGLRGRGSPRPEAASGGGAPHAAKAYSLRFRGWVRKARSQMGEETP